MSRSLKLYCDDILISCDKILRYTDGLDYDIFIPNQLTKINIMNEINIKINGQSLTCESNIFLPQLLETLSFNPRLIAIEYNGEILHRQYWEKTSIKQGDQLEIVTIVGGG